MLSWIFTWIIVNKKYKICWVFLVNFTLLLQNLYHSENLSSTLIIPFPTTCLNRTSLGWTFVFGIDRCLEHAGWIKISYNEPLFQVRFIQDSALFRVRLRQVSLYYVTCLNWTPVGARWSQYLCTCKGTYNISKIMEKSYL